MIAIENYIQQEKVQKYSIKLVNNVKKKEYKNPDSDDEFYSTNLN